MDDLIKRQAAVDALGEEPEVWLDTDVEIAQRAQWRADKVAIEAVPTAGCEYWDTESNYCALYRPAAEPMNKLLEEIVVEYPDPDTCPYQEYKGKPYFLIRYLEDRQHLGFGTYKPEVLSQYLKEYFVHPVEPRKGKWIEQGDEWEGVYYECSCCKEAFTLIDGTPTDNHYYYCPNCGADMRGEPNDSV